jgi:hypothetical protein
MENQHAHAKNADSIVFVEEAIELDEKAIAKLKRIETEKKELLNRVMSGNIENLKDKVAAILNMSVDARNSDIDLAWAYWQDLSRIFLTRKELHEIF